MKTFVVLMLSVIALFVWQRQNQPAAAPGQQSREQNEERSTARSLIASRRLHPGRNADPGPGVGDAVHDVGVCSGAEDEGKKGTERTERIFHRVYPSLGGNELGRPWGQGDFFKNGTERSIHF
ncbi:MAG: hypothetical protein H0W66_01600 [Chthoniobacterales bacterium]|nr:hypothetical protein [Chthoniobacterales bacterium]